MTGTLRFKPRHRRPAPLWSTEFVVWCLAAVLTSAAGGVWLGFALSGR